MYLCGNRDINNVTKVDNNASKSLNRTTIPYHICVDIATLINVTKVDDNASNALSYLCGYRDIN